MSQDNCPSCGEGERYAMFSFERPAFLCGSKFHRGHFSQSELCKTRQELQSLQNGLIAELCPCGRADGYECEQHSFDLLMRVREMKARAEKIERELRQNLKEQSDRADVTESALNDIIDRAKLHRVEAVTSKGRHLYWTIQQKYDIKFDERTCPALAAHMQTRGVT